MYRRNFLITGAAFALAASAQTSGSKLDVAVSYTGEGTVDEGHKIYVVIWDSPDFMKGDSGSIPSAMQAVTSKSATAHLDGLQKSPVYVSMVFDSTGKWDAASPPPSGSPIGVYWKEPGTPTPVELDSSKTVSITATFDDSIKMP